MKKLRKTIAMLLALAMSFCLNVTAWAAPVDEATIDTTRSCTVDIYKYDLSSAEKDGIWDSSYVSTGVRDENGVESVLGDPSRVSPLNEHGDAYGYAIRGVEFSYAKIADIRTYSEVEDGSGVMQLLYGIAANETNNALLSAIGVSAEDRYTPADDDVLDVPTYYYSADTLIDGLQKALDSNSTAVKNALETYIRTVGGTAMTETDEYGHTSATMPVGLYLFVETRVPEMVTDTTDPFLVSLPMTSTNGTNASDGGERWIYDITLYPKNATGIPSLEKTLRESKADTGKNNGSTDDITDGYAHTGTASDGDVVDYQIISTLPSITSAATYLSEYSFVDKLSKGITYNKNDVVLEFYKDAACKDKITTWAEQDGKFTVTYNAVEGGGSSMTIAMTEAGLSEINTSAAVYSEAGMVNSGYSDCTLRITYAATVNSDASVVFGEGGNPNDVVLVWRRSNSEYYDTLVDDAHIYVFGIDITKQFSDGKGDFSKVEFLIYNDTDNYYLVGELNKTEGVWYITGHVDSEAAATHFIPTSNGKLIIKGVEPDTFTLTEVKTDNAYNLLKHKISVVITVEEGSELCSIYTSDALGVLQNDPRYADVEPGRFHNMPQKHLEHKLLTASSTVDNNKATMTADGDSQNAYVPFTVVNTRGFDLPQTGSFGNWMFPAVGLSGLALAGLGMYFILRKKKAVNE